MSLGKREPPFYLSVNFEFLTLLRSVGKCKLHNSYVGLWTEQQHFSTADTSVLPRAPLTSSLASEMIPSNMTVGTDYHEVSMFYILGALLFQYRAYAKIINLCFFLLLETRFLRIVLYILEFYLVHSKVCCLWLW